MASFLVPDVVGMRFAEARRLASDSGVALANPDPDGPPISALDWDDQQGRPGNLTIARQEPAPGHMFSTPWESLRVWLISAPNSGRGDREAIPSQPSGEPPSLVAHAESNRTDEILDLVGDNERGADALPRATPIEDRT
jgi:hypothetical protein